MIGVILKKCLFDGDVNGHSSAIDDLIIIIRRVSASPLKIQISTI